MSIVPEPLIPIWEDKYCFVYCGPERCNCRRGKFYEGLDEFTAILRSAIDYEIISAINTQVKRSQQKDENERLRSIRRTYPY